MQVSLDVILTLTCGSRIHEEYHSVSAVQKSYNYAHNLFIHYQSNRASKNEFVLELYGTQSVVD